MTYDELKASIPLTANRVTDAALIARVPALIELAEAEMARRLKGRFEVQTLDLTVDDDYLQLPCGFNGVVSINGQGDRNREIVYVSSDVLDKTKYPTTNGYTVSGKQIYFSRSPGDIRLRYNAIFVPLSVRNRTNWILCDHPDAYLYGALKHAAPFLEDDERMGMWRGLFEDAITTINLQAISQTYGGPLTISSARVV